MVVSKITFFIWLTFSQSISSITTRKDFYKNNYALNEMIAL